ncbi:MAG: hypothetical protein M0P55_13625, partial [Clostridiales bacterium]|nr:hypothetical protein [Clostridiales bacterium]
TEYFGGPVKGYDTCLNALTGGVHGPEDKCDRFHDGLVRKASSRPGALQAAGNSRPCCRDMAAGRF